MAKKRASGISRRDFVRLTGTGALAAGIGPAFLFPGRAQAQQKTLKILQWILKQKGLRLGCTRGFRQLCSLERR